MIPIREPSPIPVPVRGWRFPADRVLAGAVEPPDARTMGALVEEMAARRGDAEALVFGRSRYSYRDLAGVVRTTARGLVASGVGKNDHVAVFMGNRPEWTVLWLALNHIGATVVGVSTWSSPNELTYILRHSDARMLVHADRVGSRDLDAVVDEALAEASWSGAGATASLPMLRAVVRLDTASAAPLAVIADRVGGVGDDVVEALGAEVRGGDVALLLYTSGSTATPKGVQLVHRDLIENGYDIGEAQGLRPDDRYWLSLPLFWSAGSANTSMAVLTHGATIVLQEYAEAATAAKLLRDERISHYFGFPNVTRAIRAELGDSVPLPFARVASGPAQPEALRFLREMGFRHLLHPYGTTEDYGWASVTALDDPFELVYTRQGRPLPGIEVLITDPETGAPVAAGEPGEICLRGHVTIGYYKDEVKNRTTFDDNGLFHTGDSAVLHADGRLEFLGRLRELIKTAGFNVSPAEVEATLLTHTAVAEAYVVGVPDEERGEVVAAFVRFHAPRATAEELREYCAHALSSYKVPRRFVERTAFPMTATGKVSKQALVDQLRAESAVSN